MWSRRRNTGRDAEEGSRRVECCLSGTLLPWRFTAFAPCCLCTLVHETLLRGHSAAVIAFLAPAPPLPRVPALSMTSLLPSPLPSLNEQLAARCLRLIDSRPALLPGHSAALITLLPCVSPLPLAPPPSTAASRLAPPLPSLTWQLTARCLALIDLRPAVRMAPAPNTSWQVCGAGR